MIVFDGFAVKKMAGMRSDVLQWENMKLLWTKQLVAWTDPPCAAAVFLASPPHGDATFMMMITPHVSYNLHL